MASFSPSPSAAETSPTSTQGKYKPPAVFSLHGIRTRGKWQKDLSEFLGDHSIQFRNWDYGHYGIHQFLRSGSRDQKVDEFKDWYVQAIRDRDLKLDVDSYERRPSIIAHSFGTYIVGKAMLKYEYIKFDKVLFCGSILPCDFDWEKLIAHEQVNLVRNEYGADDVWCKCVRHAVRDAGPSGAQGFGIISNLVDEKGFESFRHSDYFDKEHMRKFWLPFLERLPQGLQVLQGREIQDPSFETILQATRRDIDAMCFGSLPNNDEVQIPWGLSLTWVAVEPDIYTFLLDRQGRVRGYINAMPVTDELYEGLRCGKVENNEVQAEQVESLRSPSRVKLYLMSIAIAPSARKSGEGLYQGAFEMLMHALVEKLLFYAERFDTRVTHVVATAWTPEGKKLCQLFGMKRVGDDRFGHPIFEAVMGSYSAEERRRMPALRRLLKRYRLLERG